MDFVEWANGYQHYMAIKLEIERLLHQGNRGCEIMGVGGISIEIPFEVLGAVKLPPEEVEHEFRKELAVALYQRGVLSLGKARLLAQMTRWEFEELIGKRRILRHYTSSDLEEDVRYGLGYQ